MNDHAQVRCLAQHVDAVALARKFVNDSVMFSFNSPPPSADRVIEVSTCENDGS